MNSTIKKLLTYIKKYKIQILFSLAISAMSVWLSLYIPIIVANAIDYIIGKNQVDFTTISGLILQIVQIAIVVAILQWMINIINNKITFLVARDLRNEALKKLEKVPLKYIDTNQHGDIVSRVISDVDQIVDGLLMGFTQIFTGVLTILITLFFMFSINYKMAIIVIVLTPLSLFIAKFISKRTYHLFEKQSETRGEETAFLNEMVVNQKTVIAYGEEKNGGPCVSGRGGGVDRRTLRSRLCNRRIQREMVCQVRLDRACYAAACHADHGRRHVLYAGICPGARYAELPSLCQVLLWRQGRQRRCGAL